ncbi:DUF2306 domain-containing protein [Streptomyces tanashiensis]|uniref:DUF2306 domain-containing protein n=1 Tax=Streptomyces tanashiensis TaxID=67367 RepID=A0ABY6R5L6_9ACTN|nr:DUF2306 domain-containing protein [Streptomyces tanashiensis]UZX25346.1 DUF2306 domain-containing protein [Streptomyces tanashiensis]GGY27603.1 hypothetical protein GCM10010299_37310 [Streptomyces tanashiensis]
MRRPTGTRWGWGRTATVAVTAVCLAYAPIAMTEIWPYARPGAPAFGEWLLGRSVSPEFVAEAVRDRMGPYGRSLVPLIVHSVLGGLLMLLGPVQLLSAVRRRIRLHRIAGTVFAVTVYVSMAGAALYLVRTPPAEAFSGAAFWIVLATILAGTVGSVTFGVLAAVRGFPDLHQRWMLLCYGFLMTAPLLRIEWGLLPSLYPGLDLRDINRVAIMHLGALVSFGALLASRALDRRTDVPGLTGTWCPLPVRVVTHLAGAAGLVWITAAFLDEGTAGRRLLLAYLVPYAVTYAVIAARAARAGSRGAHWAREEWSLHLAALCLAPAFSAVTVPVLERTLGLDRTTALVAGVGIGCGMLAYAAVTVVSLRILYARELLKRRGDVADRPTGAAPAAATAAVAGPAREGAQG